MAFNAQFGPAPRGIPVVLGNNSPGYGNYSDFDIFEWYPQFLNCHKYFLDVAQHTGPVQALAAFLNIQLPFQKQPYPVMSSNSPSPRAAGPEMGRYMGPPRFGENQNVGPPQACSLIPYIRRMVATGHDSPGVLHGLFGDNWAAGVGCIHEIERRNFLFAAKSTSWLKVKQAYDMSPQETVPFLRPLSNVTEQELHAADTTWSEWKAMQDWKLGPREFETPSPTVKMEPISPRVKREPSE